MNAGCVLVRAIRPPGYQQGRPLHLLCIALSIGLLQGGCVTEERKPVTEARQTLTTRVDLTAQVLPLSPETRASLRTVGIVNGGATNVSFTKPLSHGAGMASGAVEGVLAASQSVPLGGPFGPFCFLAFSAVGIPIGATIGYVQGMSETELRKGEQELQRVIADLCVNNLFCERLFENMRTNRASPTVLLVNGDASVADPHPKTILHATVDGLGLKGERSRNAPLTAWITVRIVFLRAGDGGEVFEQTFNAESPQRTFREWTADEAQVFREKLVEISNGLARHVTQQLFPQDRRQEREVSRE